MRLRNAYKFSILIFTLGFLIILTVALLKMLGIFDFGSNAAGVHYHIYPNSNNMPPDSLPQYSDLNQHQPFVEQEHSFHTGHSVSSEESEITTHEEHVILIDSLHALIPLADTTNNKGYYGVDVSHYQHKVDWTQVASSHQEHPVKFAIMKATQGHKMVDSYFKDNWEKAPKVLNIVGAYHFFTFHDDPLSQAALFLNTVSFRIGNIRPVVDIECYKYVVKDGKITKICDLPPRDTIIKNIKIFSQKIEQSIGVKPIIYTSESFYTEHLQGHLDDHYFWMARYAKHPPRYFSPLSLPNKMPHVLMWQFTNSARVHGKRPSKYTLSGFRSASWEECMEV